MCERDVGVNGVNNRSRKAVFAETELPPDVQVEPGPPGAVF